MATKKRASTPQAPVQETTQPEPKASEFPDYGRDQEIKDRQEAEKAAAREEHNRLTGGGGTVADRQNNS